MAWNEIEELRGISEARIGKLSRRKLLSCLAGGEQTDANGRTDGRTEAWRERNLRITLARILSVEQWPRDVAIAQSRGVIRKDLVESWVPRSHSSPRVFAT